MLLTLIILVIMNKGEVSSKRCYDVRREMHCLFDGRQVTFAYS